MSKSNRRLLRKRQAQSRRDKKEAKIIKMNEYLESIIRNPEYLKERFTENLLFSAGIKKLY